MAITQLQRIKSGVWNGLCPYCCVERTFTAEQFDLKRSGTKVWASFFKTTLNLPQTLLEATAAVKSHAVVGCEVCGHPMRVCGNCRMAFSVDPNALLVKCENCKTANDGSKDPGC